MARVNPYMLPRPERRVLTRDFVEEVGGEPVQLTVSLVAFSLPDQLRAAEEAERMWTLWGVGEDPAVGPAPFPEPGITPSRSLFSMACHLWVGQVPPEGEEPYSPVDWVVLLHRLPQTARGLQELVAVALGVAEERQKNSAGAPTDSSCVAPSP